MNWLSSLSLAARASILLLIAPLIFAQAEDYEQLMTMSPPELPAWLANASWEPAATPMEIKGLVEELGAETFARRNAAEESLVAVGLPALPFLKQLASKDPEVRERARNATMRIGKHLSAETLLSELRGELRHGVPVAQKTARRHVPGRTVPPFDEELALAERRHVAALFALRRHLPYERVEEILASLPDTASAAEARNWFYLLGQHGFPVWRHPRLGPWTTGFAMPSEALKSFEDWGDSLNDAQRDWIERCAASKDGPSSRIGRLWKSLLLDKDFKRRFGESLRGNDAFHRDMMARAYARLDPEGYRTDVGAFLKPAKTEEAILTGLDLYHNAVFGMQFGQWKEDSSLVLAPIAVHLSSTNPVVRDCAAISMFMTKPLCGDCLRLEWKTPEELQAYIDALHAAPTNTWQAVQRKSLALDSPLTIPALRILKEEICPISASKLMAYKERLPHRNWGSGRPAQGSVESQRRRVHVSRLFYPGAMLLQGAGADYVPEQLDVIRFGPTSRWSFGSAYASIDFLSVALNCPPEAVDAVRAACLAALESPNGPRRMHAARALVALEARQENAAQKDRAATAAVLAAQAAALEVLHDSDAGVAQWGRAGLVLADLRHEPSRERRMEVWTNAPPGGASQSIDCNLLARNKHRALYAVRDDPRTKAYVAERFRTACAHSAHQGHHRPRISFARSIAGADAKCRRCAEDKWILRSLLWDWQTTFPTDADHPLSPITTEMNWLLDPTESNVPPLHFPVMGYSSWWVRSSSVVEIDARAAERLDHLTGGTRFTDSLEHEGSYAFFLEYQKWMAEDGSQRFQSSPRGKSR